jgi:decaprenylphospho-beta-D-erythro-pentofuranosid-2-ulose 2-reductase
VVLSSVAGLRPRKSNYVYGASKAGLDAFANGMADSLAPDGVKVVVVRPGFVKGRMTAGMPSAPLATTPHAVGQAVQRALLRGDTVAWAPPLLRLVAPVLLLVPRRVWRRLEL